MPDTTSENKTILIMDDNPLSIRTLIEKLQGHGFRVEITTNINQAVQISRDVNPDCMVIDLYAPGDHSVLDNSAGDIPTGSFNQGELLGEFAKRNNIPFLYLTANRNFLSESNEADCLEKNDSDEEIIEIILNKLGER